MAHADGQAGWQYGYRMARPLCKPVIGYLDRSRSNALMLRVGYGIARHSPEGLRAIPKVGDTARRYRTTAWSEATHAHSAGHVRAPLETADRWRASAGCWIQESLTVRRDTGLG